MTEDFILQVKKNPKQTTLVSLLDFSEMLLLKEDSSFVSNQST